MAEPAQAEEPAKAPRKRATKKAETPEPAPEAPAAEEGDASS